LKRDERESRNLQESIEKLSKCQDIHATNIFPILKTQPTEANTECKPLFFSVQVIS